MFKKIKSLWVILIGWFGFSSCASHQNTTDPRSGMYGPPPASFEPDRTVRLMYGVPPTRFETEKVEMEDGKSEDE